MKTTCLLPLLLALAGCASQSPIFIPYSGVQNCPRGFGSNVDTNYCVPVYYGSPDTPYVVIGNICDTKYDKAAIARCAKSAQTNGADALMTDISLSGIVGYHTSPGHTASFTSGSFYGDQYSGTTTTSYYPGVTGPEVVFGYDAIKWEDSRQANIYLLRSELDWLNSYPDGVMMGESPGAVYLSAQIVQQKKRAVQTQLDYFLSHNNQSAITNVPVKADLEFTAPSSLPR